MRVRDNALYLAKHNNGDPKVVEYFAIYMTASDGTKITIQSGPEQPTTQRPNDRLSTRRAVRAITTRLRRPHPWKPETTRNPALPLPAADADRLDIGRVGIRPSARYLFTEHAKAWSRIY